MARGFEGMSKTLVADAPGNQTTHANLKSNIEEIYIYKYN